MEHSRDRIGHRGRRSWALWTALLFLAAGCPKKLQHPNCDGDKDCRAGETCVNKRCVKCASDSDCKKGQACVEGACTDGCASDDDCADGKVCKDHRCVPCVADGDCGEAGQCQDGHCLRAGACGSDNDCPEDEDCKKGYCQASRSRMDGDVPTCALGDIPFGFDQFSLDDSSRTVLQTNAECIKKTKRSLSVVGHTDVRGTEEYNIALSDKRARMVADYLARLGVDPERMRMVPKGEAEATGSDEAGWTKDRRVELSW